MAGRRVGDEGVTPLLLIDSNICNLQKNCMPNFLELHSAMALFVSFMCVYIYLKALNDA